MSGASIRIQTWKAQRTVKDVEVPSLTIVADVEAPDMPAADDDSINNIVARHQERFRLQAKQVVWALLECLPGGLVDAILGQLLDHKRSVFIVAHGRPQEPRAAALEEAAKLAHDKSLGYAADAERFANKGDDDEADVRRSMATAFDELTNAIRDLKESK